MSDDPTPRPPHPRIAPRPYSPDLESEEPTNPRIKRSNYLTRLLSFAVAGGFSIVTMGSVAIAYEKLRDAAADAGRDAASALAGQAADAARLIKVVDADLQQHKASEAQQVLELKGDVHSARGELRDLYKAVMEGKRSAVLEAPLPPLDGGK